MIDLPICSEGEIILIHLVTRNLKAIISEIT